MINVLIYGLIGNRKKIERILDDNVNICGYMDMGAHFDGAIHSYENKPFYSITEIDKIAFDYIVVCSEIKDVYFQCEKLLVKKGVPEKKIIPTWYLSFEESVFQSTYDEFIELDRAYEVVIFGMSFSRMGIVTDLLGDSCYKFSLNGMDIHAFELYIKGLLKNSQHFNKTKCVIFDMPYAIFNRDNCALPDYIIRRMCMYNEFEDFDSFGESEDAEKMINQYRVLKQIVGKKYEKNPSSYSNNFMSLDQISKDENFLAGRIWSKFDIRLIKKNEARFKEIITILKKLQVRIVLVVFPFTFEFMQKNRYIIDKNKKMFYKRIEKIEAEEGDLEIWDYCNYDNKSFPDYFFRDQIHLNYYGAIKMTQLLKKDIVSKERLSKSLPNIRYTVYVPGLGWLPYEDNGKVCGTSGVYYGIRGIRIENNEECSISYQIYSLYTGWSELETEGRGVCLNEEKTIDAFKIFLSPKSKSYMLRYKVYIWGKGWSEWSSNGDVAGDICKSNLIEAIQIEVLEKDNDG